MNKFHVPEELNNNNNNDNWPTRPSYQPQYNTGHGQAHNQFTGASSSSNQPPPYTTTTSSFSSNLNPYAQQFKKPKAAVGTAAASSSSIQPCTTSSSLLAPSSSNEGQFLGTLEYGIATRRNHSADHGRRLPSRKFVPTMQGVDELVSEQNQHIVGPDFDEHQNVAISVVGGDGDGDTYMIRSFDECRLMEAVKKNLTCIQFYKPTTVQCRVIPLIQKTNKDLLCLASTGTGKTGAFLIPIISRLEALRYGPNGEKINVKRRSPKAIIIAHTRELVQQIEKTARILSNRTGIGVAILMGGVDLRYTENQFMRDGCDIVVATPGRLGEYVVKNGIQLDDLQFLVVDEMDKFFSDREFIEVFRYLKQRCQKFCRTLMFSATLDNLVQFNLEEFLHSSHYRVEAGRLNQVVSHVKQIVIQATILTKKKELMRILNQNPGEKTVIFVNEGRRCDRLAIALSYYGFAAMSTNGRRTLTQRVKAQEEFNAGKYNILVGTDVIARGMNLPNLTRTILYDLPLVQHYEQFIHRVGRTGRRGNTGTAIVFFNPEEPNDRQLAGFLAEQLEQANQPVPQWLAEMLQGEERLRRQLEAEEQEVERQQQRRNGHSSGLVVPGGNGRRRLEQQQQQAAFDGMGDFANSNWR